MPRELPILIKRGVSTAQDAYLDAVASQLELSDGTESWRQFAVILARTLLVGQLIGMARIVRQAELMGAEFDFSGPALPPRLLADRQDANIDLGGEDDGFVVGQFSEALAAFQGRIPRLASTVRQMALRVRALAMAITRAEQTGIVTALRLRSRAIQEAIDRSFWVSDVDPGTSLNLRALIADALRGREIVSLPEFISRGELAGAANLTKARLEIVFRNNVQAAFNDGQAEILRSPEVQQVIPIVMIDEIRDRRTRGNPAGINPDGRHWQVDGYVNTIDEIDRQRLRPPNGHQCRATLRPISVGEARRMGLLDALDRPDPARIRAHNGERQEIINRGEYPDPGFGTAA